MEHPGCLLPYITLTRETAKDIIWPALTDVASQTNTKLSFKKHTGAVEWPNGSKLILRGCENEKEGEKLRGLKFPKAFIDEAQAFPGHLKPFIEDIIEPALMDFNGSLVVTGTPNSACAGVFYDMVHGKNEMEGWSVHSWTMVENEGLRQQMAKHGSSPEEWLQKKLKQKGWDKNHPTFLREYQGVWIRDTEGSVYALKTKLNVFREFPDVLVDDWEYILGIDVGFSAPSAFVVIAYSEAYGKVRVWESEKQAGMLASDVAVRAQKYMERYPIGKIVVDTGGIGKPYAEEMRTKYHLPVHAAEKQRKMAAIDFLNADLAAGSVEILQNPNQQLIDEMLLLQWDEKTMDTGRPKEDKRFANHLCDALLYAHRFCRHTMADRVYDGPAFGSKEYWQAIEKEMWDQAKEEIENPRSWWEG